MNRKQVENVQRLMFDEQKDFVIEKIGDMINLTKHSVFIDHVDPMGWSAIIRTDTLDLVFTYYDDNCWKIETFPVYSMSGKTLRSARI